MVTDLVLKNWKAVYQQSGCVALPNDSDTAFWRKPVAKKNCSPVLVPALLSGTDYLAFLCEVHARILKTELMVEGSSSLGRDVFMTRDVGIRLLPMVHTWGSLPRFFGTQFNNPHPSVVALVLHILGECCLGPQADPSSSQITGCPMWQGTVSKQFRIIQNHKPDVFIRVTRSEEQRTGDAVRIGRIIISSEMCRQSITPMYLYDQTEHLV